MWAVCAFWPRPEPGSVIEAECDLLLELDFLDTGYVQVEGLAPEPAALFPPGSKPARPGISTRSWGQEQTPVLAGNAARNIVAEMPCPVPQGRRGGFLHQWTGC